jgi:hypothetical protein
VYREEDRDAREEREAERRAIDDANAAIDRAIEASQQDRLAAHGRDTSRWVGPLRPLATPLLGSAAGSLLGFLCTMSPAVAVLGGALGFAGALLTRLIDQIPKNPNPPKRSDLGSGGGGTPHL